AARISRASADLSEGVPAQDRNGARTPGSGAVAELAGRVPAPAVGRPRGRDSAGVNRTRTYRAEGERDGKGAAERSGEAGRARRERIAASGTVDAQITERGEPLDRDHGEGTRKGRRIEIGKHTSELQSPDQ